MNDKEKFINLCETSDYVMVNGYLGTYVKDYDEIVFPRNGMCPPNIKVSDYDYCKFDGEKWILACNSGIGYYHHVRFLNEVKNSALVPYFKNGQEFNQNFETIRETIDENL